MHTHIREAFKNVTKPGEGVLKQFHVTEKNHRDRGSDLDLDQCLTKQTKSFNWF